MNLGDAYSILGMQSVSSEEEMRVAYRDLVMVWHPDKFSHNERLRAKAEEKLKEINTAFDLIKSSGFTHVGSTRTERGSSDGYRESQDSESHEPPSPPRQRLDVRLGLSLNKEPYRGNVMAFSPDGKKLATTGKGLTYIWNLPAADLDKTLPTKKDWGTFGDYLDFFPDGQRVIFHSTADTLVLNVSDGNVIYNIHNKYVDKSVLSPDGSIIANVFSGVWKSFIRVLDASNGHCLREFRRKNTSVPTAIALSPNKQTIAIGTRVTSGLFTGNGGEIELVDSCTGSLRQVTDKHNDGVTSIAFAPAGHMLASSSYDNSVKLWRIDSGDLIRTLTSQNGHVLCVCFSPDGAILASGHKDGTVKLWDSDSGELRQEFAKEEHELITAEGIRGLAFSPCGTILASGDYLGVVNLWQLNWS